MKKLLLISIAILSGCTAPRTYKINPPKPIMIIFIDCQEGKYYNAFHKDGTPRKFACKGDSK